MRTTLTIDDDILSAAKSLAQARSIPIGTVISELARKGMKSSAPTRKKSNFAVFSVSSTARTITIEDVKKIEDEA